MKRLIMAALVAVLAGCSGAPADTTVFKPAAAPTTAPVKSPEDKFYDDVQAPQWLPANVRALSKADTITTGRKICEIIGKPDVTRPILEAALVEGTIMDARTTSWVIDAAHNYLCPGKPYAYVAAPVTTMTPPPPPVPAGPATVITGDGTFEVGVDIAPGKYKTKGSAQGASAMCYWARLKANGEDIIDNDLGNGSKIATVKAGELFETARCGIWTKS